MKKKQTPLENYVKEFKKAQKLLQQVKSYHTKDKYDEADAFSQEAILLYQNCEVLKDELVDILYEEGKDELAENLNKEFRISYGNLLFFTGLNLSRKDDAEYDKACKYYQQAINMHPDRCTPYINKHQDFIKSMEDVIKYIKNTKPEDEKLDLSNIKLSGTEIKYSIIPEIESSNGNFKNIKSLVVSWSRLGDNGATAFAEIIESFLPALKNVDFTGNSISTNGIKHLAPALKKAEVEIVRLPVNKLDEYSASYISFMVEDNKVLSVLHLFVNELGSGVLQIQKSTETAPRLSSLTYQDNKVDEKTATAIISSKSPNQTWVCLGDNDIDLSQSKTFFKGLAENDHLDKLDLYKNNISVSGAKLLAGALEANKTLRYLDIKQNNLGPEGIKNLKDGVISNKTLKTLKLNNNNIGPDEGSKAIAEILIKSQSLENLDISNNNIQDKGIKNHIAKALGLTKIKEVIMRINKITDEGAECIIDHVHQKITIDLSANNIIDENLMNEIKALGDDTV
jgi:Ran GTPase-activating protein (RanGAP) involved in mRNA processing and transport